MNPLARVREVYDRVVDLRGDERTRALADACGSDTSLRAEVESLLRAGEDARSFMEKPPSAIELHELAAVAGADMGTFVKGTRFGAFTLLEVVGQGGMGVVYKAEQQKPRRIVALKLIRSPFLTPQLLRRFEQESHVLGLLRHPGIAQIYEAGSAPGPDGRLQPYCAMEFVQGQPLIAFAGARGMTTREKLHLFALICDAVQHAHQKGVVHRDLKPANILVEEDDASSGTRQTPSSTTGGGPQPKILDFGVARIAAGDIVATTAGTDIGQLVGTLPYMSPEQVRGDVQQIDTRSDVYALGVVLFELLTGRLPYEVKGKPIATAAATITDTEPTNPGQLEAALRGDIETIVLKALEKSPERRYQSAAEVAADIRRFLADLPIVARPATTAYQLRKFARRNRGLVGGVAAAFVLLVAGLAGTSVGMVRADRAKRLAQQREMDATTAARTAENSEQFLISILTAANPQVTRNRELTVRELLDEAAMRVGAELSAEPPVAFRTRLAISRTYASIHAAEAAQQQVDAALTLARTHYGERSVEYSLALAQAGAVMKIQEQITPALETSRAVLDLRSALLPAQDPLVARARMDLGSLLIMAGKFKEGEPLLREARETLVLVDDRAATACTISLASLLMRTMRPESLAECSGMLNDALAHARARGPEGSDDTADVLLALADLDRMLRQPASGIPRVREAIALREQVFPPNHPQVLIAKLYLVRTLRTAGDDKEATVIAHALVEPVVRTFGAKGGMISEVQSERCRLAMKQQDAATAVAAARSVVEALETTDPPLKHIMAYTLLAQCHESVHDWTQAADAYARARERAVQGKVSAAAHSTVVRAQADVLLKAGKIDEARAVLEEGLHIAGDNPQFDLVRSELHESLARCEEAAGDPAKSEQHWRAALAQSRPHDTAWAAEQAGALARVLEQLGRVDEASAARADEAALLQAAKDAAAGQK